MSFILLGTMIMLNLFIGIIMNSMSEMHEELEAKQRPAGPPADLADIERRLEGLLADVRHARRGGRPT